MNKRVRLDDDWLRLKLLGVEYEFHVPAEDLESESTQFTIAKSYLDAQLWMDKFNQILMNLIANGKKQKIDEEYKE